MKKSSKRHVSRLYAAVFCLPAIVAALFLSLFHSHAQSPAYSIVDLGTAGVTSSARGINNCGQIVGSSTFGPSNAHPFFRNGGPLIDIGTFSGGTGEGVAVNSGGTAVGYSLGSQAQRAFIWRDANGNGISDPGELVDLGTLPLPTHNEAFALGINNLNQVVGFSSNPDFDDHAFVWNQANGMQELPTINSIRPTQAYGINNGGNIVGIANNQHAFFLIGFPGNPHLIDLGTFGGNLSRAFGLNFNDYVVGEANSTSGGLVHAFIFRDANANFVRDTLPQDEMQDLGTLGGAFSFADAININGDVVGQSDTVSNGGHAFIWRDDNPPNGKNDAGEMKDLNSLISPGSGWTLQEAHGINDSGQIVGWGTFNGQTHAFLLTPSGVTPPPCPVPTPSVSVAVSPTFVPEDGSTNLVYTFTRTSESSANALTVNFSVGGTATGTDYSLTGASMVGSVPLGWLCFLAVNTRFANISVRICFHQSMVSTSTLANAAARLFEQRFRAN